VAVLYYQELLNFCARALGNRDAAADVVQEAYARILSARQAGREIRDPRALLYRIVRNLMIDGHRRLAARPDLGAQSDDAASPAGHQPDDIYAASQYALALGRAIETLPARCREAFLLNRFEGLSHQEIAERMGISRNMVAQHVIRGVLACKMCDDRFRERDRAEPPAVP